MALSTFSVPRGFLGVPAQDSHFAPAAELHVHKQLQARPTVKVSILCSALRKLNCYWLVNCVLQLSCCLNSMVNSGARVRAGSAEVDVRVSVAVGARARGGVLLAAAADAAAGHHQLPGAHEEPVGEGAAAARRRAPLRRHLPRLQDRRPPRVQPRRRGAHRRAALRLQRAAGPHPLGRRPPGTRHGAMGHGTARSGPQRALHVGVPGAGSSRPGHLMHLTISGGLILINLFINVGCMHCSRTRTRS
jgi:hypothetical protein